MLLDGGANDAPTPSGTDEKIAALADEAGTGGSEPTIEQPSEPTVAPREVKLTKSRKAQAEEDRRAELKALQDGLKETREAIAARDRQIGELTGHMQALAQRPAPQQQYVPQAPAPQLPDPDHLQREAIKALDNRDMNEYHRLLRQSHEAGVIRQLAPFLQQQQQRMQQMQAPQQEAYPSVLMPYMLANPDLIQSNGWQELVAAKDLELKVRGVQAGPDRVRQAFVEANAVIQAGKKGGAPSFSQSSAAVLSGTPTARPSNGSAPSGDDKVVLSPAEQRMARVIGEERYVKQLLEIDPGRRVRS